MVDISPVFCSFLGLSPFTTHDICDSQMLAPQGCHFAPLEKGRNSLEVTPKLQKHGATAPLPFEAMHVYTHIQMYNITYNIPIYTGAHIHIKYIYTDYIHIHIHMYIYYIYVSGISICCWVTGVTARMRKRKAKVKGQRRRGVSDPDLHLKITVLNQQMGSNGIE